jgi:hypothetical protein
VESIIYTMDPVVFRIRVAVKVKEGAVIVYGHLYRRVFDKPVNGVLAQIWINFELDSIPDKFISDDSLDGITVLNPVKTRTETLFSPGVSE